MSCYCDDTDAPSMYNVETRKARKAHKCSECRGAIAAGETYEHVRGVWDGDPATYKTCQDCAELRKWAEAHVKCICWAHGETHSIIRETMDEYDRECPGLKAEAIGKMSAIRRKRREAIAA